MSRDVAVSFRGHRWQMPADVAPERISLSNGKMVPSRVVAMAQRRDVGDLGAYFEPRLRTLMPDPNVLTDMRHAVDVFVAAMRQGHRVGIIGDYDVDGATSTSLVVRYLRECGHHEVEFYIPQRLSEGYGANVNAVEHLQANGAKLLLILDSGTVGATGPIGRARELGMEVVIIDHHEPGAGWTVPQGALVVNPKRPEEDGSLAMLCTAGLVMLFLAGVNRVRRQAGGDIVDLFPLMGLAALGTVADLVPLRGLNRAYVQAGLPRLADNEGLATLMSVADYHQPTTYACGFVLGPCINAGGRLGDTMQGARLLTGSGDVLRDQAQRLFETNQERRLVEKGILLEAAAPFAEMTREGLPDVLVVHSAEWHPGVIGIVASRLKEMFDRSAVVIGQSGKGSGRSVPGFNLGEAFLEATAAGLLIKGGGHAAAGGLTIDPDRIPEFRDFLLRKAAGVERKPERVDEVMELKELTEDFVRSCEMMAPFGMGNPRPRLLLKACRLDGVDILANHHLRIRLSGGGRRQRAMLFGGETTPLGVALLAHVGQEVDLLVNAEMREWQGREEISIRVEDVRLVGQGEMALSA